MSLIRKNEYPSKTTVNLVMRERSMVSPSRVIPLFLLFLVLLAGFVKFGVVDALYKMNAAQEALNKTSVELSGYAEYNKDYSEVKEQYSRYFSDYLNEDEVMLQNRIKVLKLLNETVEGRANITNISIKDNVCRIVITQTALSSVSDIVADLEESPMVRYISVSTAATQKAEKNEEASRTEQGVTADITVTLTGGNVDAE